MRRSFFATIAAVLLCGWLLAGCATTCCQCERDRCAGCPEREGLTCMGSCGGDCFYCPKDNSCSCDAQCLSPPTPAPERQGGAPGCQRAPRLTPIAP